MDPYSYFTYINSLSQGLFNLKERLSRASAKKRNEQFRRLQTTSRATPATKSSPAPSTSTAPGTPPPKVKKQQKKKKKKILKLFKIKKYL